MGRDLNSLGHCIPSPFCLVPNAWSDYLWLTCEYHFLSDCMYVCMYV